jgi:3-deoxy-D-manno-octulosonic-acid transferase
MLWLYNFGISFYGFFIKTASLFNSKARLFLKGRKNIFSVIEKRIKGQKKHIWFHFASLGEFEQGRPVLEQLKKNHPEKGIIVTFFSPSGYEIRKDYPLADGVFYLPLDTRKNAEKLISLIDPEIAIFTKYEFWYHYFKVLHDKQVPLFIVSGIFRPDQIFFKWYGGFNRKILQYVDHFFLQNEQSIDLLKSLKLHQMSLSGDTRFDRVAEHAQNPKQFPVIARFCGDTPVFIAGSTWPQDEQLIVSLIARHPEWKFIIAPHEVHTAHIHQLMTLLPGITKYTDLEKNNSGKHGNVLLIDNIGMLSAIYQYGKTGYIGGGFGTGIHNTLEAAAFGLPVIFGPNYKKFQEAKDLLGLGAAISIRTADELCTAFEKLQKDPEAGHKAGKYVKDKTGATAQIVQYLEKYI